MRILRSPRVAAMLAGSLVAAMALPVAAFADTTGGAIPPAASHGATIRVTSVTVTARVVATVNVDYVCQPLPTFDWTTGQTTTTDGRIESGGFVLLQAQGRTVDSGFGDPPFGSVTCDGSTANHLAIPVIAGSSPWKTGTAVVGANLSVIDPNMTSSDDASTGPITVRLTQH